MPENISIAIRNIQHYLYCPHRWGLMEIGNVWAENYFVTKANLIHKRVHSPDSYCNRKNMQVYTGVEVYNDTSNINIHGVIDCLEMNKERSYFCIVEYKPTMPKDREYNEDDAMQVFAQKICLDKIFCCNADAVIYYADAKMRIRLPLNEMYDEYMERLKAALGQMRHFLQRGTIPPIPPKQKCSGCSLRDTCMPRKHKKQSIRDKILESAYEKVT